MIQRFLHKFFGTRHERELRKLQPMIDRVGTFSDQFEKLDDDALKRKTVEFRERIGNGESLDALLPEAFATVRCASMRALGMRHYDVQLVGGIVMHRGAIAEMRTGEGKTLTATLALYLNALPAKGAHLVTVNEYLARRDAEWMGQLYGWLGLTTGVIYPQMPDADRQAAYGSDITYGTNSEFGFDYLRDNMKFQLSRKVQRDLSFAIVDEVDSILIDEARTPLIISGNAEEPTELYLSINNVIARLKPEEDYIVDEENRSVTLTEEGISRIEERLEIDNLFDVTNLGLLHHVNKALEAHTLYRRDEKYLVRDGKIVIIDDFTGRAMDGRRWSDGLHQAIEAKEGVSIQQESVTMATVTYQNFYRMYEKLSGMTGTADTEAEEFSKIYKLDVQVIPTNRPIQRIDQPDLVYRTEREKFAAIVDEIIRCHEKGQPVLIGTVSVDKSEVIARVLQRKGIPHNVLNAKFHEQEADIIAQAGRKGAITIATNMAGRGTDILLGGNPEALARQVAGDESSDDFQEALGRFKEICAKEREEVLAAGGLFILGTERHDSRRIDNQLRGRAGRQGDPGESRFYLSLEDELMKRFGAERIQNMMQALGMEEGVPIEHNMVSKAIENAQRRMEGRNFDIRKNLLEYDDVMDMQRKTVYGLRDQILGGEGMEELVLDVLDEALASSLDQYANTGVRPDDWDMDALQRTLHESFLFEFKEDELPRDRQQLERTLWKRIEEALEAKVATLEPIAEAFNRRAKAAFEAAKAAAEAAEATGEVPPPLPSEAETRTAREIFLEVSQSTYIQELDRRYRTHLQNMRTLREAVSLQGYAQKDPKQIYKKEGFALFSGFKHEVATAVAGFLFRFQLANEETVARVAPSQVRAPRMASGAAVPPPLDGVSPPPQASGGNAAQPVRPTPRRRTVRIGRNDPCWCGSGKKYKHCHMKVDAGGGADESGPPASGEGGGADDGIRIS